MRMPSVPELVSFALATEGYRDSDQGSPDDHHQKTCAPWPSHPPAKGKAGEEQHGDRDGVGNPQGERHVVKQDERRGNREKAQKHEQEDTERAQIVFLAEPNLDAVRRKAGEMEADALEVERRQGRQHGWRKITGDKRTPFGGAPGAADRLERRERRRRSPRAPIRYMTASMVAQARLHPSKPMSTARTSARAPRLQRGTG